MIPSDLTLMEELLAELEDQYDGADDSRTKWIGWYLDPLRRTIQWMEREEGL